MGSARSAGRIGLNKEMILKHINDVSEPIYYIVGPTAMVEAMERLLLELNVNANNIKLEKFG